MAEHTTFVGDTSTVGTVSMLTLLAFSAKANVRTVGIGVSILINGLPIVMALQIVLFAAPKGQGVRWSGLGLAAVVTGLIWESADEWMPQELKPEIMKSLMGVMAVASFAVLASRRESDIARVGGRARAIGLTCVILIYVANPRRDDEDPCTRSAGTPAATSGCEPL